MSVGNIGKTRTAQPGIDLDPGQAAPVATRTPKALFAGSTYTEAHARARVAGVALPTMSQEELAAAQSLTAGLDDEKKARLTAAGDQLATALFAAVREQRERSEAVAAGGTAAPPTEEDNPWAGDASPGTSARGPRQQVSAANAGTAATQVRAAEANAPSTRVQAAEVVLPAGMGVAEGRNRQVLARGAGASTSGQTPQVSVATPGIYTQNPGAATAVAQAQATYQDVTGTSGSYDHNINAVVTMGLVGLQTQMGDYAKEVDTQNKLSDQVRVQYANFSDAVANWPEGQKTMVFTWTSLDKNTNQPVVQTGLLTKEQAQQKMTELRDTLDSLGASSQTQQLRLQKMVQDYQQATNLMSNLLKFEFDTAKAIIGNIRTG